MIGTRILGECKFSRSSWGTIEAEIFDDGTLVISVPQDYYIQMSLEDFEKIAQFVHQTMRERMMAGCDN